VTLLYDALGRRIGKHVGNTATWFLYDGDQVMMDLDSATYTMKAEYGYRDDGTLHAVRTQPTRSYLLRRQPLAPYSVWQRRGGGTALKSIQIR